MGTTDLKPSELYEVITELLVMEIDLVSSLGSLRENSWGAAVVRLLILNVSLRQEKWHEVKVATFFVFKKGKPIFCYGQYISKF